MANRLVNENSPYLLQHKENPVEWYPWGPEALEKAKLENKPIFLSIGYAACHWCHVMEHESFEDPQTASIMNQNFINIKVDREERPDLDGIYMKAVVSLTGQGGWPMSVFLTPDKKPFYGGTYFPPVRRYNMPSFGEILLGVAKSWKDNPENILQHSEQLTQLIVEQSQTQKNSSELKQLNVDEAKNNLIKTYDWEHGGWGKAPKFPQAMTIQFLLRHANMGDKKALDVCEHALRAMAKGGMYDIVGGGFARYSVDNDWLVPHFEKMLYDNAQLARAYLQAYKITKNPFYKHILEETLDFIVRELSNSEGGFFSSLDADSEGVEGKYYIWEKQQIQEVLSDPNDMELFASAYDIQEGGNFEGQIILRKKTTKKDLASKYNTSVESVQFRLKEMNRKLYLEREKRIRPATDDKVLTSWNGLMLVVFAEAGRYLERKDYVGIAQKNANFLLTQMRNEDGLYRSYREGKASHNAYLEDYASLILGLLATYQSDFDNRWYAAAEELSKEMINKFSDSAGSFFDTSKDHEELISRPKEMQDNATPSGNSLAAQALLLMASFSGNGKWYDLAIQSIGNVIAFFERYPTAFGNWLCAADFALAEVKQIAILGNPKQATSKEYIEKIWTDFQPNLVVAFSNLPIEVGSPALLKDRLQIDGLPTAYLCQHFVCKMPVTNANDLMIQLSSSE